MHQSCTQTGRVHTHVEQHLRYRNRVNEVRLTALAYLVGMGCLGPVIRLFDEGNIGFRKISPDLFNDLAKRNQVLVPSESVRGNRYRN